MICHSLYCLPWVLDPGSRRVSARSHRLVQRRLVLRARTSTRTGHGFRSNGFLCNRPSFCLSVCFWVWRCGNGSAVTGFLRSGASGAQRLVRWSKPRRAPPLAEAALGPLFQYREAESPRCGERAAARKRRGRASGTQVRAEHSKEGAAGNFFVRPPTRHAPYRIPAVGGVATALPLPASYAQELRALNG